MLSIVTHGIIGASYRKDVVVEGEMDASDLAVLCDQRSKLSFDSSGDAPQSGWLIQPAPSGMWLSRLELALDEQNRPAYVATSFLIPRGSQLRGDASLVLVIRTQMMNRHNYINERNIIMARPDWSFLKTMGQELESHLSPCSIVAYRKPFVGDTAYYPNAPASMLREMWDDNFSIFGTVFCGKGLLSPNADYPNVMEVDFAEQVSKQEEEELRRKETEEARIRQEQEAQRRKEAEEAQMWQEEEARRRKEAEEARVKLEEEAHRRKEAEEARIKQEEARRRKEEEEARIKQEEALRQKDEEEAKKRQEEERHRKEAEEARIKQEEEEARRRKEAEKARSHITNTNPYGLIEGVDYNRKGTGWMVADIICTIIMFGAWFSIAASIVLLSNVKVKDKKYHRYRKTERTVAIVCLILSSIILLFGIFVLWAGIIATLQEQEVSNIESSSYKVNGIAFNMNKVEGGTFMMGADGMDAEAKEWEKPAHWVTLSDYCIGETEVTQELWEAVMGKNSNISDFKGAKQPVERVSWEDCQEFLTKLNDMTGKEFRLPTEAEWEFAARGGKYSKQYKYSGSDDIDEVAWYFRNSGDKYIDWNSSRDTTNYLTEVNHCRPHPVKQKKPNELGLYDMTGNVLEWCSDWYDRYSAISITDPQGPESANPDKYGRVRRGGYYLQSENYSRITYRIKTRPNERHEWLGFRLALSVA